jgi:transposase
MARIRMKARHDDLVQALDGRFDDHHGELAQLLLDQIAFPDATISGLENSITASPDAIPASWGIDADGAAVPDPGPGATLARSAAACPARAR